VRQSRKELRTSGEPVLARAVARRVVLPGVLVPGVLVVARAMMTKTELVVQKAVMAAC